jgi:hypothetical protein
VNEKVMWRGLTFVRSSESHRGYERWDSESRSEDHKPFWSADRYPPCGMWYARLLVFSHRIVGKGPNMRLALDDAREKAKQLRRTISKELPK